MRLIDITKENWKDVLFLSTNENITVKGSRAPYGVNSMPSLCEEFVASNAFSIVQSIYEEGWVVKAIENDEKLIGFTMYGWNEEENRYELCRFMIDYHFQNKGYGTQAIRLILDEMKTHFDCKEIYLYTNPENMRGKHIYEKMGFRSQHKIINGEELFKLILN